MIRIDRGGIYPRVITDVVMNDKKMTSVYENNNLIFLSTNNYKTIYYLTDIDVYRPGLFTPEYPSGYLNIVMTVFNNKTDTHNADWWIYSTYHWSGKLMDCHFYRKWDDTESVAKYGVEMYWYNAFPYQPFSTSEWEDSRSITEYSFTIYTLTSPQQTMTPQDFGTEFCIGVGLPSSKDDYSWHKPNQNPNSYSDMLGSLKIDYQSSSSIQTVLNLGANSYEEGHMRLKYAASDNSQSYISPTLQEDGRFSYSYNGWVD